MTNMPETPTAERNFLDDYFGSVYNKLEADALLFNRKLPHAGLAGAENELAVAALLRDFLPPRFGIDVSGIVIDRVGRRSRQADIIIYDAEQFPRYLRKVFPVELVHAVIEVKTSLTSSEARSARENLRSLFELEFRPLLTPYWETRFAETRLAQPPLGVVFAFRSDTKEFATFTDWFPLSTVTDGVPLVVHHGKYEIRSAFAACLDKGVVTMSSTNLLVNGIVAVADVPNNRSMEGSLFDQEVTIDPAKSLFLFLETLWQHLADSHVHPGFDIRSYMSRSMDRIEAISKQYEQPEGWYAAVPSGD